MAVPKKHQQQTTKREQTAHFQKLYEQLNAAQKAAVDRIEGPVLVIAGPGTGKTQVLSARIARILQVTDVQPHNILALTFTESAAKNMRQRVVQMIGSAGYSVVITTFHAFCQSVMQQYPEYFAIQRDAQPLSDIERFALFESLLSELELEALKPLNAPLFYLRDVMKALSDLKREGVSVAQFEALVEREFAAENEPTDGTKAERTKWQKQKEKNTELAVIYAAYEARLRAAARYDFDDMIALTAAAFAEHEELAQIYQEQLQYILVDEYQDTNSAQAQIVHHLTSFWGDDANIFAVGDPHQSIYRFQGASTENMLAFLSQYPSAAVVTLSEGYRCPQPLSDAAHALIQTGETQIGSSASLSQDAAERLAAALSTPLASHRTTTEPALMLWHAPSQTVELIQVAEHVQQLLAKNVPAEEIAILYRNNKEAEELSHVFDTWDIPYELEGGTNILETPVITALLLLFETISLLRAGSEDGQLFALLSQPFFALDTTTLYQLSRTAGLERTSLFALITAADTQVQLEAQGCVVSAEKLVEVQAVVSQLISWGVEDMAVTFPAFFETVIAESGYLEWLRQSAHVGEDLQALHTIFDQAKQLTAAQHDLHLDEFLAAISVMRSNNITLTAQGLEMREGAVCLSTAHRAKGREWQYVFVIHCVDGVWGNARKRVMIPLPEGILQHTDTSSHEQTEDDRRLLYVALTRAKVSCILSYPETLISQTRVKDVTPSMFIAELQEAVGDFTPQHKQYTKETEAEYLARLVTLPPVVEHSDELRKYLQHTIDNFTLSVTALNTYLRDPQDFLYNTVLRVPQAKADYLAFGTAVHAALERLFVSILGGTQPSETQVIAWFETALKKEILLPDEYARRREYGEQVLRAYLAELDVSVVQPWQTERILGTATAQVCLDDIPLTGRIDRFDWIDREEKLIRVVDYKTGSPKSSNDIEGRTSRVQLSEREQALPESVRGPYKRQLLFYKLLAELDPRFLHTVTVGSFEFIEPDKRTGRRVTHQFPLVQEDVEDLKTVIREVMQEIRALKFLEATAVSNLE